MRLANSADFPKGCLYQVRQQQQLHGSSKRQPADKTAAQLQSALVLVSLMLYLCTHDMQAPHAAYAAAMTVVGTAAPSAATNSQLAVHAKQQGVNTIARRYTWLLLHTALLQLMLTKARTGPLQEADIPAGVLLSTVVNSPVARYCCSYPSAHSSTHAVHLTACGMCSASPVADTLLALPPCKLRHAEQVPVSC